ncbi:MAG: sugar ABC transporter substrate-binding protein [Ruminococcus sp.]|jgi:ribose transport system substrate-binding protein
MMKRKVLAVIMAIAVAASMTACGSGNSASESSADNTAAEEGAAGTDTAEEETNGGTGDSKGTILFSTKTITNNEFQRIMVEKCEEVVEAAGYTFELALSGDELTVSKQVENVENAINRGVDGIIVAPMDGSSLVPALEKAKEAGIPVIIADSSLDEGNDDLFMSHVGSDNIAIGYEAGQQMAKAIGEEGKVCVVRGAAGAMGSELRSQGFEEAIAEYPNIEIVNEQLGNWLSDVAMQVTENMLTADPDMDGIFLCSDGMLSGVISGVQNKGMDPSELCIISVDGNISALDAIKAGTCYGCVAQYPANIGEISANTMIDVLNGDIAQEDVEHEQDSGYFFMCPDTIEESEEVAF